MRRREFLGVMGGAAAWPLAARAQPRSVPEISPSATTDRMTAPNPIPAGPDLDKQRHATYPKSLPKIPETWRASILLSPFGDSSSPLPIYSQLVVGTIEYSYTQTESWMRVGLYLTQSKQYFEFVFITVVDDKKEVHRNWYWIDSTPNGRISNIYGPFQTTLQVPWPNFFQDRSTLWGNAYPLMCTDTNSKGINCEHWVLPTPAPRGGHPDHGSWFTFRKDTGSKKDTRNLFRVLMTDATNPLMIPILGSYFFTNLPTFRAGEVSDTSNALIERIRGGEAKARADYWNPMVTQEDIHRAMAFPLASADCTPRDIEAVIPGFIAPPIDGELPLWSPKTYIEGWTIGTDFVPYFTRVCYLWTGDADSKQQSVFVGLGSAPGQSTYLNRKDACLNTKGVTPVIYKWNPGTDFWEKNECRKSDTGLVRPDWVARGGGVIMGKIRGNPDFGLAEDQTIELIAVQSRREGAELAIFWLWFLNGTGMLFSEGNYLNPLSHNLQLIDYTLFKRDAALTQSDFSRDCTWPTEPPQVPPGVGLAAQREFF